LKDFEQETRGNLTPTESRKEDNSILFFING